MNIRLLHDRVAVKRLDEDRQTASGIVIPNSALEKPEQGVVVSVGPGVAGASGTVVGLTVAVGDSVMFGKYAGQTIKIDGEDLLVMKEEDIMLVVERPHD